jgi:hypothetical protein
MKKAFRLRSQGLPFKQIGAVPMEQPIVQNPNDPQVQQQQAQMQQQRAPLMQVAGPGDQEELTTTYDPNAPVDKTKKKGNILKGIALGAVDMLTAGLDRVYSTGKTDTLGGSKALTFAKTKAELAEEALKAKQDVKDQPITEVVVENEVVKEQEK